MTIWNSVALVIAAAGLGLLAWALFADRAKSRLRCPKCWYSLDGTPADDGGMRKCPECGRGKLRDKSLKRTRRRWRYVFLALLVFIVADQSRRIPAAHTHGWVAFVPTTLIIPLAPIQSERWVRQTLGSADHLVGDRWSWCDTLREEIFRRNDQEECWVWQGSAWATLAAWRPMGNQRLASTSIDVASLLSEGSEFDEVSRAVTQLLLVDCIERFVSYESWLSSGGDRGNCAAIGNRVLIVNGVGAVSRCKELLAMLQHPSHPDQTAHGVEWEDRDSPGYRITVYDFRHIRGRYADGRERDKFFQRMRERLQARTGAEHWGDIGGKDAFDHVFAGRMIVLARTDVHGAILQHLPLCTEDPEEHPEAVAPMSLSEDRPTP